MESKLAPEYEAASPPAASGFHLRQQSLQARVNEAAKALLDQGIRPTVARIRAALGGGSPNDLAPTLRQWREVVLPTLPVTSGGAPRTPALPLQVTDLVYELWQRARAAALVEVRGGPIAREVATRTGEAQSLRQQVSELRDRLERESLAYGELRASAARHEAIAREAVNRAHEGEVRERDLLREVGILRQRVAELEAAVATRGGGSSRPRGSSGRKRKKRQPRKVHGTKLVRNARGARESKRGGVYRKGKQARARSR